MGTALNIGAFAISHVKLNTIAARAKAGEAIESVVERVWDKIVDFFCGTCRDEAKHCLSILYSPRETDSDKIVNFLRLRELVGAGYADLFEIRNEGQKRIYSMRIDWHPECQWELCQVDCAFNNNELIRRHVTGILNGSCVTDAEQNVRIVSVDLPRGTFVVNNKQIEVLASREDNSVYCQEQLESLLSEMHCSKRETLAAYALLGQHLFATLLMASAMDWTGRIDMQRFRDCLGASRVRYELARGDDGQLKCSAGLTKDISLESDDTTFKVLCDYMKESPGYLKSMNIHFVASIQKSGEIAVSQLEVRTNDAPPTTAFAQSM